MKSLVPEWAGGKTKHNSDPEQTEAVDWKSYSAPQRHERYAYLQELYRRQEKVVADNLGLLGEQARRRRNAQARMEELRRVMEREFPQGPPRYL